MFKRWLSFYYNKQLKLVGLDEKFIRFKYHCSIYMKIVRTTNIESLLAKAKDLEYQIGIPATLATEEVCIAIMYLRYLEYCKANKIEQRKDIKPLGKKYSHWIKIARHFIYNT